MKIAVVTSTRAEYGILRPLLIKLNSDPDIQLQLLVTGTHLSEKFGNTQVEIEKDGLPIFRKIPILEVGNNPIDISRIVANAITGFARYFDEESPCCVIILGDRTEMMGVCIAAMNASVPIVHLHGGEVTEGAVDDYVRHAISKMSYLHFPSNEIYRKRIIQMGENPDRVYNVGALGVENILSVTLIDEDEIRAQIGIPKERAYVMVTFHPVTMERGNEKNQVYELINAMNIKNQYFYLVTMANADTGGDIVNLILEDYAAKHNNAKFVTSLGMKKYLSAMKYSKFVLGNSSSGIIEAPSLGIPTVNIGDRQKGRVMSDSIICCLPEKNEIVKAIEIAEKVEHKQSFLYGNGKTSDKIISILKDNLMSRKVSLKKTFYDIGENK